MTAEPDYLAMQWWAFSKGAFLAIVLVFVGLPLLFAFLGGSASSSNRPQSAASLMSQAEFSLRQGQFTQAAGILNRVVSEHPTSPQRITVDKICSILRDKENNKYGPVTADEAQGLRKLMYNFEIIKRGYWNATPQTQRDLEVVFGAETFRQDDNGLDAVASTGKNLEASRDRALQGR